MLALVITINILVALGVLICFKIQPNTDNGAKTATKAIYVFALVAGLSSAWYQFIYNNETDRNARTQASTKEKLDQEVAAAKRKCNDTILAYVTSKSFVKPRLKSPSTAVFPSASAISSTALGGCKFSVSAYVDAQNSFGATIRTPYSAILEYFPKENSWTIISLEM